MLDIQLLRKNPTAVKTALARRSTAFVEQVDIILVGDIKRREAETKLQTLQADRNRLSKEIGMMKGRKEDSSSLEAEVKNLASEMEQLRLLAEELETKQRQLLLALPNMPHSAVPDGDTADHNKTVRHWGTPFSEKKESHIDIGERLGLFDLDRATKLSGSGYVCFTGKGARLERALIHFLLDVQTQQHGYTEMSMPVLVRRDCMIGTGQLPKFEEDMYGFDEGTMFLTPTAEVSLTNFYREEILAEKDLPIKLAACTPCFRREAGSAGRETRGIIRMHQFHKIELVQMVHPETAEESLLSLTHDAEKILQLLELPYRVLDLCAGDLGVNAQRTFDLEVWAPGQQAFLEVSSCSHFGDYQARRMNLRYKATDGKNYFCHTLNGSGTALPRLYVALLETHTQPGGPLMIPKFLQPYFGAAELG
jgi:seryl-tRNA synthetase